MPKGNRQLLSYRLLLEWSEQILKGIGKAGETMSESGLVSKA